MSAAVGVVEPQFHRGAQLPRTLVRGFSPLSSCPRRRTSTDSGTYADAACQTVAGLRQEGGRFLILPPPPISPLPSNLGNSSEAQDWICRLFPFPRGALSKRGSLRPTTTERTGPHQPPLLQTRNLPIPIAPSPAALRGRHTYVHREKGKGRGIRMCQVTVGGKLTEERKKHQTSNKQKTDTSVVRGSLSTRNKRASQKKYFRNYSGERKRGPSSPLVFLSIFPTRPRVFFYNTCTS